MDSADRMTSCLGWFPTKHPYTTNTSDTIANTYATHFAVAIRVLFPHNHCGISSSVKNPIMPPNTPNGTAGPAFSTHVPTKNVHAKLTTALMQVIATKQSADRLRYESIT